MSFIKIIAVCELTSCNNLFLLKVKPAAYRQRYKDV
jgi:hypothetical protein